MAIFFSLSIFLGASLLFIVQPLIAKKLLPWFGGSPLVWLSIVLFFQTILLLGYLYAYGLTKLKSHFTQIKIHGVLITASLFFLPIIPLETHLVSDVWPPISIFILLISTLCLPAILLSASSPLLQYWYCQCYQTDFPYRYYALSNAGSLLGLLAFPFLLEPYFGLKFQFYAWSVFYMLYILCVGGCLYITYSKAPKVSVVTTSQAVLKKSDIGAWTLLTFLGSTLLLSSTQVILQNVAGFPLLWVAPLSLYLITFIITFGHPRFYVREIFSGIFAILCATIFYYPSHHTLSFWVQIALYSALLFSGCMICHGELIRLKPHTSRLTTYYLFIALGGVLGGVFVNLIAPVLFNQWWDFYLTLFAILLCAGFYYFISTSSFYAHFAVKGIWLLAYIGLGLLLCYHINTVNVDVILNHRNFFGSFEVADKFPNNEEYHYHSLTNGNIIHGKQFVFAPKRNEPTTYYSQQSGIGLAIAYERQLNQNKYRGLSIGVIGLGAGTIASLSTLNDSLRFYEIDPDIEKMAKQYFYYLHDAKAKTEVIIGDGRIKLLEELANTGSNQFDVLAIDAFSGDAIPVHLLTLEAMQIYLSHLSHDGILAFHISSRYVDLYPPLQALATHLKLFTFTTVNDEDLLKGIFTSKWVLMSQNGDLGAFLYVSQNLIFPPERMAPLWTDDYNTLLNVIKW
ncbi:MAG: fused MFS/spermidine synthase [Proteobacteria bacterium]|nr:fused MFS/spermidine synthase [Pseudomonadota bacterium]